MGTRMVWVGGVVGMTSSQSRGDKATPTLANSKIGKAGDAPTKTWSCHVFPCVLECDGCVDSVCWQ